MGDEIRRSQRGNNNCYCHDTELAWLDWSLLERHADVHRFVKLLIQRRVLRTSAPLLQRKNLNQLLADAHKSWHGINVDQPDWSDSSHSIAFEVEIEEQNACLYMISNAFWEALEFELPSVQSRGGKGWRRWIDTALESPEDIVEWQAADGVFGKTYRAEPRSVVVLYSVLEHDKLSIVGA